MEHYIPLLEKMSRRYDPRAGNQTRYLKELAQVETEIRTIQGIAKGARSSGRRSAREDSLLLERIEKLRGKIYGQIQTSFNRSAAELPAEVRRLLGSNICFEDHRVSLDPLFTRFYRPFLEDVLARFKSGRLTRRQAARILMPVLTQKEHLTSLRSRFGLSVSSQTLRAMGEMGAEVEAALRKR